MAEPLLRCQGGAGVSASLDALVELLGAQVELTPFDWQIVGRASAAAELRTASTRCLIRFADRPAIAFVGRTVESRLASCRRGAGAVEGWCIGRVRFGAREICFKALSFPLIPSRPRRMRFIVPKATLRHFMAVGRFRRASLRVVVGRHTLGASADAHERCEHETRRASVHEYHLPDWQFHTHLICMRCAGPVVAGFRRNGGVTGYKAGKRSFHMAGRVVTSAVTGLG